MVIKKVQLHIMFRDWWETDLTKVVNIRKEQIINVVVEEGKVYLIYWE